MKRLFSVLVSALTLTGAVVGSSGAITGNYVPDNEHPFVGLVAFYDSGGTFMWRCSGSLIAPKVFLTAGHCTDQAAAESPTSARIWFEQAGGASYTAANGMDPFTGYPVTCLDPALCTTSTHLYDYGFDGLGYADNHDTGLIVLDEPVALPEYGQVVGDGFLDSLARQRGLQDTTFTASGYGVSRYSQNNPKKDLSYRVRLMAETQIVNITSRETGGTNLQLSSAPAAGRGGTCFGDSGGPIFSGAFASNTIVGVNSFVLNGNCRGVGFAYRTDQAPVLSWIQGIVPADQWAYIDAHLVPAG